MMEENLSSEEGIELKFFELSKTLETSIKKLYSSQNIFEDEVLDILKLIQKQTRFSSDQVIHQLVIDKIVNSGIGHVFLKLWHPYVQSYSTEDQNSVESPKKFLNLQYLLSIVWNCSDSSGQMCETLVRSSVLQQILSELSTFDLSDFGDYLLESNQEKFRRKVYLLKAYLGIVHNIMRLCGESRKLVRVGRGVPILLSLLEVPNEIIKAKIYLILSYVFSLSENSLELTSSASSSFSSSCSSSSMEDLGLLRMAEDLISFLISILRDALSSENNFSQRYAFSALEITSGINHLAINDNNKASLGKLGIFNLLLKMMSGDWKEGGDEEEMRTAASGLWILSFHPLNKQLLRSEPSLLSSIDHLSKNNPYEHVRRCLRGALWVVGSQSLLPSSLTSSKQDEDSNPKHIMISYHWSSQKMMMKVRDSLIKSGYKVWFDVDNMKGSTLEAMALAVERSEVILISVSSQYKNSPNCRTEAEYAFRLKKEIIPLLVQEDYCPDGWLGILAGTKMYYKFSQQSPEEYEVQIERLKKEIGVRGLKFKVNKKHIEGGGDGKEGRGEIQEVVLATKSEIVESSLECGKFICSKCGSLSLSHPPVPPHLSVSSSPECDEILSKHLLLSPTPLHGYAISKQEGVKAWGTQEVSLWLETNNLSYLKSRLASFDGPSLLQLKSLQSKAPEFFFSSLQNHLKLDLLQILKFTKHLDLLT